MSGKDTTPPASFLDCPVCSQIDAVESSFSKYGWPDDDQSMSSAVNQLIPAEELTSSNENHHLQRCSLCGTFYRYDFSYEYLVNGSEDSATLLRLAPADARRYISDDDYDRRMQAVPAYLQYPDARLQRFGGACLVAHHLRNADLSAIQDFLLQAEPEAGKGAVVYLLNLIDNYSDLQTLREMAGLEPVLTHVIAELQMAPQESPRYDLGKVVGYLYKHLFPKPGR